MIYYEKNKIREILELGYYVVKYRNGYTLISPRGVRSFFHSFSELCNAVM